MTLTITEVSVLRSTPRQVLTPCPLLSRRVQEEPATDVDSWLLALLRAALRPDC